jgi:hypothetical protein
MAKGKIFKVNCEYFIKAKTLEEVKNSVIDEIVDGDFYESHIIIDEEEIKIPKSEVWKDLTK